MKKIYKRETDYDDFNIVLFSNDSLNFFPTWLKPIGEVKMEIRKPFDDWMVEFQNDDTERGMFAHQWNLGPDNTCVKNIYGNAKIQLSFPENVQEL